MKGLRIMNLSILLTDFIDTEGILKTYRFVPINPYNRVVVDKLTDICADIKGKIRYNKLRKLKKG